MGLYLDNSATTKPYQEAVDVVIELLKNNIYANPNSVNYEEGMYVRKIIENARTNIAEAINAYPEEVYFTASASASNNLAIRGYMNQHPDCCNWVTTNIEHSSILDIQLYRPHVWKHIETCDTNGFVTAKQFSKYKNCLISVMGCNNEVGSIQPIKEIADEVHKNNCIFHTDLTQYIPYKKVDVKDIGCDMATFSMHKLHSLKGCGVLYIKNGLELAPLISGSQEHGLYAGTEDIYAIASAGKAITMLSYDGVKDLKQKRDYLLDKLLECKDITLNGVRGDDRSPCNINICIHNIELDNIQLSAMLDLYHYQIATGSSCHSGDKAPSHVLLAMGMQEDDIHHSIRITVDNESTNQELDEFCKNLFNIIQQYHC